MPEKWWEASLDERLDYLETLPVEGNGYGPIKPSERSVEIARELIQALKDPNGPYIMTSCDGMIVFEWFSTPNRVVISIEPDNEDGNLSGHI